VADIPFQGVAKRTRRCAVRVQVEMLDFLPDYPIGHGVDIAPRNVAPYAISLHERRSTAHERIGDTKAFKIMTVVEGFLERRIDEFREQKRPEQCSGAASKPFMDGDRRPIVLLDLLFPQSQSGHKWNIEKLFYHDVYQSGEAIIIGLEKQACCAEAGAVGDVHGIDSTETAPRLTWRGCSAGVLRGRKAEMASG